jgi:hypothetical protein
MLYDLHRSISESTHVQKGLPAFPVIIQVIRHPNIPIGWKQYLIYSF